MASIAVQSSRPFLIRKGLVRDLSWTDRQIAIAAPGLAPFHTLPVRPIESDIVVDLITHDFDDADHGQTTW